MNNKTIVLIASILLVVPFIFMVIGAMLANAADNCSFDDTVLGNLLK